MARSSISGTAALNSDGNYAVACSPELSGFLEALPYPAAGLGADGCIEFLNSCWAEIAASRRNTLIVGAVGFRYFEHLSELPISGGTLEVQSKVLELISGSLRNLECDYELPTETPAGTTCRWQAAVTRVTLSHADFFIVSHKNITESRRIELRRIHAEQQAIEWDRLRQLAIALELSDTLAGQARPAVGTDLFLKLLVDYEQLLKGMLAEKLYVESGDSSQKLIAFVAHVIDMGVGPSDILLMHTTVTKRISGIANDSATTQAIIEEGRTLLVTMLSYLLGNYSR